MKIFTVDFKPIWPVGSCLIIAANNLEEAETIASDIITHTGIFEVTELHITKPCVIEYMSGEY